MPTQKYKNRNIRKLTKVAGKTLVVSLPIEIVRQLGWKERQKVMVTQKGSKLIISDWKPKRRSRKTQKVSGKKVL